MFVSNECCVLSGPCVGLITHKDKSYRMCFVEWVWSGNPVRGGHDPELGRSAKRKKNILQDVISESKRKARWLFFPLTSTSILRIVITARGRVLSTGFERPPGTHGSYQISSKIGQSIESFKWMTPSHKDTHRAQINPKGIFFLNIWK